MHIAKLALVSRQKNIRAAMEQAFLHGSVVFDASKTIQITNNGTGDADNSKHTSSSFFISYYIS